MIQKLFVYFADFGVVNYCNTDRCCRELKTIADSFDQFFKLREINVYIFEIFGDLNDYILLLFNRTHNV